MLKREYGCTTRHRHDKHHRRTLRLVSNLVVAHTVVDISGAISSPLEQPFAAYLAQVVDDRIALAILALTIMAGFSMGQGRMITASRVT